jgi:nitrite reductase (cytochrome c-552)
MSLYRKLGREAAPQATGAEQIQRGLVAVGNLGYWDAHKALEQLSGGKAHPVSCVDCHDPGSMELRVTRPAFITAIQKLAAGNGDVPHLLSIERWRKGDRTRPYDPNLDATRQEKRSYVCAQCHVEYFCGKGTTVFFPWDEGLKVEEIESLYDGMQVKGARFKDWTHAETGMEVLKAQHPEFEVWSQGLHARSGVACADCHMPYRRDGAQKISEHWVRSPLLSPNRSCATCHPYGDEEIKSRVATIQERHFALLTRAGQAAVAMLDAIDAVRKPYDDQNRPAAAARAKESLEKNADFVRLPKDEQEKKVAAETKANLLASWRAVVEKNPAIKELGELQRAAQWRLDFVAAENSMGFHAPQEMARILGEAIDLSRQAEVKSSALLGGRLPAPAAVVAEKGEKKPVR